MKHLALLVLCWFVAMVAGCDNSSSTPSGGAAATQSAGTAGGASASGGTRTIAVIPKGTTHEFWKSIHAGANKAAQEMGCEIIWKGPLKEDDSASQIAVVEDMLNSGVSGIVVAPNDENALARIVDRASGKLPVVIIDSDVKTQNYKSFVATNNKKGGKIGGAHLAKLLNGKGKVIMLRYQEGSASTQNREQGFLDEMKKHPEIQLVSVNQYSGATSDSAQKAAENLLAAQRGADGGLAIDGIFTPNEPTTAGMLMALKGAKAEGKVKFVGFDASEKLVTGLKAGQIHGLVLQDPVNMGYLGVKTMMQVLNGATVEKRIDTGVHLATPENIESQEIKDLVNPPLAKYGVR